MGSVLADRIKRFFEVAGPIGVILLIGLLLMLLVFVMLNKRKQFFLIYLFCLAFSGFTVTSIDLGSTLLRWIVMFLIALTGMYGVSSPGTPSLMIGAFAFLGMITCPVAPSLALALQFSGLLFVATVPMAAAISNSIATREDIYKIIHAFFLMAGVYVLLGFSSLGSLAGGGRYAGATTSAPLFVLTGGLLLPMVLWGSIYYSSKKWKWYCVGLTGAISFLIIISGQRTGTYAGIMGCVPILAKFGAKRFFSGLMIAAMAGVILIVGLSMLPEQAEYVKERFFSADTTGRMQLWTQALQLCLENPFLGKGFVADSFTGFGFHQAYLVAWYNGGIIGFLLFTGAIVMLIFQSLQLMLQRFDSEISDIARLFLGISLATFAAGFAESKLLSPSNIAIFTAIITSIILHRLKSELKLSKYYEGQYYSMDTYGDYVDENGYEETGYGYYS